jgi:hypothetical protein
LAELLEQHRSYNIGPYIFLSKLRDKWEIMYRGVGGRMMNGRPTQLFPEFDTVLQVLEYLLTSDFEKRCREEENRQMEARAEREKQKIWQSLS